MAYKSQKQELKRMYGSYCMLCERKLKEKECTFHHIVPKSCGGPATIKNGCIMCESCQKIIHQNAYGSKKYAELTCKIYNNMNKRKKA